MKAGVKLDKRITDTMDMGIVLVCEEAILYGNDVFSQLCGHKQEALCGASVFTIMEKDDLECVQKNSASNFFDIKLKTKNNGVIFCKTFVTCEVKENKQYITICFIEVMGEDNKNHSFKKFSDVLSEAADGIIISDAVGNILWVNDAFVAISGYEKDEIIYQNIEYFYGIKHTDKYIRKIFSKPQNQIQWSGLLWSKKKDGKEYPSKVLVTSIKNNDSEIEQYIFKVCDATERVQNEEEIKLQAYTDSRTNMTNQYYFKDNLMKIIEKNKKFAVLIVSLDRFTNITDFLSVEISDELIRVVSAEVSAYISDSKNISRLGAFELGIMEENISSVQQSMNRFLKLFRRPFYIQGYEVYVTTSIGIAMYEEGDSPDNIVKNAETALVYSKMSWKNNYTVYNETMKNKKTLMVHLESNLKKAILNKEFIMHYQPKLSIKSKKIVGGEALIRWLQPEEGMINPITFMPFAEETGLIEPIGEIVLKTVCKQLKKWEQQGLPLLRISINLSLAQISLPDFASRIEEIINQYEVDKKYLEFEITESATMRNAEHTVKAFNELKRIGFSLSIDDFGSELSSLSQLVELPIDTLKIDKSFIDDLASDDTKAIVEAIIAMSHSLGYCVIAEGVESQEQLEFLEKIGCQQAQGYLIGKPMPNDEFEKFLQ